MTDAELQKIKEKFVNDPDWVLVEKLLLSFIEPLRDMATIDLTKRSDTIKAELWGRRKAWEMISNFLDHNKLLKHTVIPTYR